MSTTDPFILAWNSIKYHTSNGMDYVDKHFDSVAGQIREKVKDTHLLDKFKKAPPPPPPPPACPAHMGKLRPAGIAGVWAWVKDNKWLVTGLVVVAVGGGVYVYKRKKELKGRRRKALKAANGARKEVVVIHGQPHDPLVKSTAHDLEKRGFIVYIAVSSHEDEQVVINEGKSDIKPLQIDILDTLSAQSSIHRFTTYLRGPTTPFPGAPSHHLRLTSLLLISPSTFPTGPIETIPLDHWSDTFNLKLIQTLAITQLFLPLLTEYKSRIIYITPSIPHSLRLPFHAPEVAAMGALEGVIDALRREVGYTGVSVTQIKTGTLDTGSSKGNSVNAARADVLTWSNAARATYARGYAGAKAVAGDVKGSSMREVNAAVVGAILDRRVRRVVRVGSGSVAYEVIGRWMPEGVVGWMLGLQGGRRRGVEEGIGAGQVVRRGKGSPPGSRGSSVGLEGSVEWERVDKS